MPTQTTPGLTVPIGTIIATAVNQTPPPAGWLVCNGTPIPYQYQELISTVGPNTPNLAGSVLMGSSTAYPLRSTGGEATHTLTVEEIPAHTHALGMSYSQSGRCPPSDGSALCAQTFGMATNSTGGGNAHNNLQPYYAIIYLIYGGNY